MEDFLGFILDLLLEAGFEFILGAFFAGAYRALRHISVRARRENPMRAATLLVIVGSPAGLPERDCLSAPARSPVEAARNQSAPEPSADWPRDGRDRTRGSKAWACSRSDRELRVRIPVCICDCPDPLSDGSLKHLFSTPRGSAWCAFGPASPLYLREGNRLPVRPLNYAK